ncbi:spherulation-specific family 4 protein [Burkholderia glumae]|uniref:spherulation-specific family 4 protein n=1 Tax=Burkholderia glumae TaxID=337 RepID=UPI000684ED9C|nr:spherulation-specific family 4 protein [Burkholderia glumae]MCM2494221.1 spherulation-specific family 4 protein [Burkholderia glumae]MCM2545169.1 spherulation-specific family 4 protein [Burkholderia glumae]MCM2550976.1 spherulation-specific family 4 protein [Burkholderia glumae]
MTHSYASTSISPSLMVERRARPRAGRAPGAFHRIASAACSLIASLLVTSGSVQAADLVVPAYFYPSGSGATAWNTLATNAASVPLTAIVNPNSGPGTAADPAYTGAIAKLRAAGGKVIAYVHTSYGARPLSDVTADINKYLAFYAVDGFFIDEMANDATTAHVQYYQSLYNYIKGLSPNYQVVNNPGTTLPEIYASLPVADRFVVYENKQANYAGFVPNAWQAAYGADRFVHIVYNASASQLTGVLQLAVTNGAGGIYVTSLKLPNPYNGLPSYWSQEVLAVAALNPAPVSALGKNGRAAAVRPGGKRR